MSVTRLCYLHGTENIEGIPCEQCELSARISKQDAELSELRSILSRLGVRKEPDGTWTMPCPECEGEGGFYMMNDQWVNCDCKSGRVPVPGTAQEEPR